MSKPYILHMFTPGKNVSPFDVNMAYDAGWSAVNAYCGLSLDDIEMLVQDAIFSRGPSGVKRTGIFLGGRDADLAMDMLERARKAMVPPFEVSVFADPSGAFTTAAALVAKVEHVLKAVHQRTLEGARCVVFGGTGPVGTAAAVLAAHAGAGVTIVSHTGLAAAQSACGKCNGRYQVRIEPGDGSDGAGRRRLLRDAEVILATAKAGVEVLSGEELQSAAELRVAADVNAVPPLGITGVGLQDDAAPMTGVGKDAVGIGALAVGALKYRLQHELLVAMRESEKPVYLQFEQAFAMARQYAA